MNLEALYKKIAAEEGITPEEVKKEIQAAINFAWTRRDKNPDITEAQAKVPHQGKIPTVEEFLAYAVREIKQKE